MAFIRYQEFHRQPGQRIESWASLYPGRKARCLREPGGPHPSPRYGIANCGNVFFSMILMDSDSNHAMCFSYTVVGNETGCEALSRRPFDLIVK